MCKSLRLSIALFLLAFAACVLPAQTHPVLLISVDGLRPDAVLDAAAHGLSVPNLRRMMAEGSYASGVRGILPTVTYPSHVTLVTGVSPARHGVYSNTTFDPFDRNQHGWDWYAEDIRVETLWTAAHRAGWTTANVDWPVTVGAAIDENLPQYWRAGTEDDEKLVRALCTPGLPELLKAKTGRLYPEGWMDADWGDSSRTEYAIQLMQLKRPGFITVYLGGLDHSEHVHGVFSPESNAVLEHIDGLIGKLRTAAGSGTVVAVVSDHGFVNVSKSVNLGVKFREAGLIETDAAGNVTGWEAAPWTDGAVAYILINPTAHPDVRQKTLDLLDKLQKDPDSGIERILTAAEIQKEGGDPQASFAVELKIGYCLGDSLTGPFVTPSFVRGMHGYPPDDREMNASFFIAGPGIPAAHSLGEIDMRDIAPTLAAILGARLPSAEGRNRLASEPSK